MSLTKLSSAAIRLAQTNILLREAIRSNFGILHRCRASRSETSDSNDNDLDKPIKFSSSQAATWNAEHTRTGGPVDGPWYQGYVVIASTASFLIYFLALREENDIDEKLSMNLSDHFTGERKANLEATFGIPEQIARSRSS